MKLTGRIFDIKRFAVHDGDGIRTTLFLKGCPLRCVWCHNPEGLSKKIELAYYEQKCTSCGSCVGACSHSAHTVDKSGHIFHRELCTGCGSCTGACLSDALTLFGKSVTADEILPKLLEDKPFYETSGGGVTLSGGECLLQADFCKELLSKLKENGINTAIDTCGAVPFSAFEKVIPYTDTFLYDIKAIDKQVHKKCTGMTNEIILENLKRLDSLGCRYEIRIPYVPEYNDGEMKKISEFLRTLKNLRTVRVLPYHSFAGSKYSALGIKDSLPQRLPTEEEIAAAEKLLALQALDNF